MTIGETQQAFSTIYRLIKSVSPSSYLIWTVSPVRHIKDGLIENQRSKAALILAIEQIISEHQDCFYFPAYEILIDQLRDYRYYSNDLIHPSESAIDIIWDLFCENYMDQNEMKAHAMIEKINQSMKHRFLHIREEAITDFAKAQLNLIHRTNKLIPGLDFANETRYFTTLLKA